MGKIQMNEDVIVVLDTETTGLDPRAVGAEILELAFLVVGAKDLQVRYIFERAVCPSLPLSHLERVMHPDVLKMHTESGLLARCYAPDTQGIEATASHAEVELLDAGAAHAVLTGARPDFDRNWLSVHAPRLLSCLHYRNIDINSFWLADTLLRGKAVEKEAQAHRALADCHQALAALRRYVAGTPF